jgi:uncharacterized protein (TIGR03084 family)
MSDLQALCDDLALEHADLDAIVAPLDEAAWYLATPAEGWSILDSIVHLALTDAHATRAAVDPNGFTDFRAMRMPEDARLEFERARRMEPSEVLAVWRANRTELVSALRALDPKTRVPWFGPPMSAMSHASARLMETWAHGQDVVDTLGVQRTDTPRLRHIAHLGVRARPYSYTMHDQAVPADDVRVELSGPNAEAWAWGDAALASRVTGSARDFCLVVVQRRHLDDTRLVCEGPYAREWLLIAQAFAGRAGGGRRPGQFAVAHRLH